MSEFRVVSQVRARIIPEILSLRSRFAQFRGMSKEAATAEPEPEVEPGPTLEEKPKRRRLIRNTALLAAKSLRAPIIDR